MKNFLMGMFYKKLNGGRKQMKKEIIITKTIANCIDCDNHEVQADPDHYDWFCFDDVKVVCKAMNNKTITCACRPHRTRHECDIPNWCPLN